MNVRRPPSNVQAEKLKDGGRISERAFPTAGQQGTPLEKGLREHATTKNVASHGSCRSAAGTR